MDENEKKPHQSNIGSLVPQLKEVVYFGTIIVILTAFFIRIESNDKVQTNEIARLAAAQEKANENAEKLNGRLNTHDIDINGLKKDVDFLGKGRVSYAPTREAASVRELSKTTVNVKNETIQPANEEKAEENDPGAIREALDRVAAPVKDLFWE